MDLALVVAFASIARLYRREIAEWLSVNLRGGGLRPPSHPLPAKDGFILRGRKRRAARIGF